MSGSGEIICAVLWRKARQGVSDNVPEVVDGACGSFPQESLALEGGIFDRVEVGRLWRQVSRGRTSLFDGAAHLGTFVGGQVVHNDGVVPIKRGHQHLFDIDLEGDAVH